MLVQIMALADDAGDDAAALPLLAPILDQNRAIAEARRRRRRPLDIDPDAGAEVSDEVDPPADGDAGDPVGDPAGAIDADTGDASD